ncbi:TadE family protein [Microbacterium album]|uniref:TadE family protein n=1 Tax=Microbacterium album TaxID=2053191 RepID=UPI00166E6A6A|nr:TadE family protein [Microbacterium album]
MRARLARAHADETGSAALEFLTIGLLTLVPLVYLVLALGQIQSQALGVESAARFTARAIAAGNAAAGAPDAVLASVVREYGVREARVRVECLPAAGDCPAPGGTVVVTVSADVPLPLVPPALGLDRVARVPVEATSIQKVSRFWEAP